MILLQRIRILSVVMVYCTVLLVVTTAVQASMEFDDGVEGTLTNEVKVVPVSCPSNQSTFVTTLELVFQPVAPFDAGTSVNSKSFELTEEASSSTPLRDDEQSGLTRVMKQVYNALAEQTCDSYFRRIQTISLLKQRRRIQQHAVNATSTSGNMIHQYKVVGTCRNCPVSPSGSMPLFDDGFRRQLSVKGPASVLVSMPPGQPRQLSVSGETTPEDCQCVEGQLPVTPKAPSTPDFLEATNVEFNMLREQRQQSNSDTSAELPLFKNLELAQLSQPENDASSSSSSSESNAFQSAAAPAIDSHRWDIQRFLLLPVIIVVCMVV